MRRLLMANIDFVMKLDHEVGPVVADVEPRRTAGDEPRGQRG